MQITINTMTSWDRCDTQFTIEEMVIPAQWCREIKQGHREKTAFDVYNAFGKLRYDFSPNRNMTMSAMYSDIFNDTPATWLSTTMPYSVPEYRKDIRSTAGMEC